MTDARAHTQALHNIVYKKLRQTTLKNTRCTVLRCILERGKISATTSKARCTSTHADAIYKSQEHSGKSVNRRQAVFSCRAASNRLPVSKTNSNGDYLIITCTEAEDITGDIILVMHPVTFMPCSVPYCLSYATLKLHICFPPRDTNE